MHIPKPVYKMRQHRGAVLALLLALLPMMSLYTMKSVMGAPTYTITPAAPGRIQEGNPITLTLSVTGLIPTTQYAFYVNVTQPDGSMHAAQIVIMTDGGGSGTGSKTYAVDFATPTAGNTNFVGTYNIVVQEASPTPTLGVASNSFTVGLTDKTAYMRTNTILIQASGYASNEAVTIDINTNGGTTHANGFPMVVHATGTGLVQTSWVIPYSVQTGTWTVTASGASTLKAPVDQQTVTINIAAFLVTVTTDQKIYARTQTITAYAVIQYPNGTVLNSTYPVGAYSYGDIRVTFDNGSGLRWMNYNQTAQNWYATYTVPAGINPSNLPQVWNIQVTAFDNWGNAASGQTSVTIHLYPSSDDLWITALNSTGGALANVFLNITYANGTIAAQSSTNSTGNAEFLLPEGNPYQYWLVASLPGYNDYLAFINLQGNLMHRVIIMSNVYYSGSILAGSYTTLAHYNPGDTGSLVVWIYNKNATYPITINQIVVNFPWYATYGNAYIGNATVNLRAGGQVINPLSNWNTTVTFTVPNDGRLYSGVGGQIYISATVSAWKQNWVISPNGIPESSRTLVNNAYVDPRANPIYVGQGFETFDQVAIAIPTQDTGAAQQLNIVEILMGAFLANILLLVMIWLRLKPVGKIGAFPAAPKP